ncbi:hypothetical protein C8T65DRAFT_743595 [Cerioporus squamosus]|nr:hypothetical protein C8T65DRAFT_743595 [Cerioporus squamosus]
MNQNSYTHSPYYLSPHVNGGQGYVPHPQAGVSQNGVSMQAPLGMPQVGMPAAWQGWQPPAFVGSSMSRDMPLVPQWATPGQHQGFEAGGGIVNPFARPLAQSLLQPMHLGQHDDLAPVHLSPDDERTLVQALKEGVAEGLTPRQIVERLRITNNHGGIRWKDLFLDNVERLFPQVFSSRSIPNDLTSFNTKKDATLLYPTWELLVGRLAGAQGIVIARTATHATKLRPLLEYHANTLIPPSIYSRKPKAPNDTRRGSIKFTDGDKRGPFFTKSSQTETPHHDAEAWRKHWDSAPSLPDRIYIEARKRADNERAFLDDGTRSTADSSDGEDAGTNRVFQHKAPPLMQGSGRPAITRLNRRITEEDLHKMAEFLVEKRQYLHLKSQSELWREFYLRKENKDRRTYNGWRGAARYYEPQIRQYVDEIVARLASESDSASEEREVDERTQPTGELSLSRASEPTTSNLHEQVQEATSRSASPSLIRSVSEGESNSDLDEKRVKVEIIDLTN